MAAVAAFMCWVAAAVSTGAVREERGHSPAPGSDVQLTSTDASCEHAVGGSTVQLSPPASNGDVAARAKWMQQMRACRADELTSIDFNGSYFDLTRLHWTATAYLLPMVQGYERFLYNEAEGKYTVNRYLEDVKARYGGVDGVLLWPTYTNLGLDDRNQLDMFRAMPGGLDALRSVTEDFHAEGVGVIWVNITFKPIK